MVGGGVVRVRVRGGGWVINYQETHFFKDPPGKNKLNFRIPPTKENYFN